LLIQLIVQGSVKTTAVVQFCFRNLFNFFDWFLWGITAQFLLILN
jgi:hypothetical protein